MKTKIVTPQIENIDSNTTTIYTKKDLKDTTSLLNIEEKKAYCFIEGTRKYY